MTATAIQQHRHLAQPYADAFPEARSGWLEERVPAEPDYYEEPKT